jgi:hypothetical protein
MRPQKLQRAQQFALGKLKFTAINEEGSPLPQRFNPPSGTFGVYANQQLSS